VTDAHRTLEAPASATREVPSLRLWLRESTRGRHEALDESMSALDLATPTGHGQFLQIHIDAMQRLRPGFRAEDRRDFEKLIRCARRDLGSFGDCGPSVPRAIETPDDYARALGIAYVIRGTRLGARVLRKRVPAAFPASFLDHAMSLPWTQFVTQLDEYGIDAAEEVREAALSGANLAFEVFARCCIR